MSVDLLNRWNMVSLPVHVADPRDSILFPAEISASYSFQGGYNAVDTLVNGEGYWMKFGSAQKVSLTGEPITTDTFDVDEGWNMIGSITDSVQTDSVTSLPDNIIRSSY